MNIVNLTPHEINLILNSGETMAIPVSGTLARVKSETVCTGEIDGVRFTSTKYGEVEGLPDPVEGTVYVVSSLVAGRVPDRVDVFIPNESVRDANGRIIGCNSLGHV